MKPTHVMLYYVFSDKIRGHWEFFCDREIEAVSNWENKSPMN